MSDSLFVPIDDNGWTEISASAVTGLFTNNGPQTAFILESDTDPTASVKNGHQLANSDFYRYRITGSQKIFARSKRGPGTIVVTPD